jgi:hypothetical protein
MSKKVTYPDGLHKLGRFGVRLLILFYPGGPIEASEITSDLRPFRGCKTFSVEIRCLASQAGMVCAEYWRLEQRYNAALRRWAQYVRPQAIVPPGKDQLERTRVLRQKALIERNSASHILYLHRSNCLFCKSHEAKPD